MHCGIGLCGQNVTKMLRMCNHKMTLERAKTNKNSMLGYHALTRPVLSAPLKAYPVGDRLACNGVIRARDQAIAADAHAVPCQVIHG